jgi:hypothetical protein
MKYYEPEYLRTLKIQAIRAQLIRELRKDPPEIGLFASMNFSMWLVKKLTPEDFTLFHAIETAVGEVEANKWMTDILVESGLYETDDGETVSGVVR